MKQKWVTQIVETPKLSPQWGWWLVAAFILLSPWLVGSLGLVVVMGGLSCTSRALNRGSWRWALDCSALSGQVSQMVAPLSPLAFGYPVEEILTGATALAAALHQADKVMQLLLPYALLLTDPSAPIPSTDTTQLSSAVGQLAERLAYLQSTQRTLLPKVEYARHLVAKLDVMVGELAQLLSLTRRSQWLVLLQDDTELRATGGFIDGLGLVGIENGRLQEPRWITTTTADAQLKGQVPPPTELSQVLGETNWYLRDSNWDPHFPTSASRAGWFVSRELGQAVDMVVAVNARALGEMLKAVGSVDLPTFGGRLTTTNWRANYLQSVKLDSGERFLPLLAGAVWAKIPLLSTDQVVELMQQVAMGLETDQIQLWSANTSPAIAAAGWDGQVGPPVCNSPFSCLNDFVFPVDINIGINKTDAVMGRSLALSSQVDSQSVVTTYRLAYTNSSSEAGWPLGEWRSYLRLYLPQTAQVLQVKWAGSQVSGERLTQVVEAGMQKLALQVSVPPAETKELEVVWRQAVPQSPRWHHQLFLAHQSGVGPFPARVTFSYPTTWWSQAGPSPTIAGDGVFGYNSTIDRASSFNIDWVPSL